MQVTAKANYLRISPRKLRLSADLVRGNRVIQADYILAATPKKGAVMVADALKSAVANAENNYNLRKSALYIAEIKVDEGPRTKRFRPRSRGMAHPILHRMAHLTVILTDQTPALAIKKSRPKTDNNVAKPVKAATKAVKETT